MKSEILIQYCDLKREIEGLEKRIDKLEKQSETVADVVQNGYKGRAVIYGVDCYRAQKLKELKQILQERYDMVVKQKNDIERFIKEIPKSEIRQIFEHRYIDGMNWVQIAYFMNEIYKTDRYNDNSVRKKHDRYLKKF